MVIKVLLMILIVKIIDLQIVGELRGHRFFFVKIAKRSILTSLFKKYKILYKINLLHS